ncbi:MAG: hypothetical protein ABEJ94_04035 [Halorientalis sp.]
MGLFDSVRGLVSGDDESGDDDADAAAPERPDPTPTTFRNKAADAVADWDAHDLDYSLSSLSGLDEFAERQGAKLDALHDEGDDSVADLHTRYTIQAGSYLGEVLVRQRDGEWVKDGDRWAVSLTYEGERATVDVFELAGHSFAEEPVFGEVADRFTDDDADPDDPEPDSLDTDDMAAHAEELAGFWDGYDLDFSPRSLTRLDELADTEWDDDRFRDAELGGEDMDSGMYTELVKQLGSYYGEVLVRSLDAEWTRRDDDIVVAVEGNTSAPPVPVPVFSVAAESLTGPTVFATRFNDLADRANLDVPEVATTAGVTPDTETPAATDRADEDLTAVNPDDAVEETGDDQPATAADAGVRDDSDGSARAAATDSDGRAADDSAAAETADASVDSTGDDAESTGDDADPLAASVVDEPSTDDSRDGADSESGAVPETDDGDGEADAGGDGEATDGDAETEPTVDPAGKSPLETAIAETVAAGLADRPEDDGDETAATAAGTTAADGSAAAGTADASVDSTDDGAGPDDGGPADASVDSTDDGAGPDDGGPADATPGAGAGESDPEAAEREALAAEISDSGPAESGPTLPGPDELRDDAEAFAATYPGYELDFSPESLERLDRLVAEEYDAATFAAFELADPDSQFQLDRVTEAGGYFALVIEGTVGGEWERTDEGLQFVVDGAEGVARLDPLGVAAGCFRGEDSFAATYAAIRDRLAV